MCIKLENVTLVNFFKKKKSLQAYCSFRDDDLELQSAIPPYNICSLVQTGEIVLIEIIIQKTF